MNDQKKPKRTSMGQRFNQQLPRTLLHAFYWIDDALQAYMKDYAGISLPHAQSMLMICIGDGVQRQSDMAQVLGVSKQAIQQALKELTAKGLVEVRPDPTNGRQKIVVFTDEGQRLRKFALKALERIERTLEQRIGQSRLAMLHEALNTDWGDSPSP